MSEFHQNNIDLWAGVGDMSARYWNNSGYIKRSKEFAKRIKKYNFSSIYEVGMCNGRNLKYIGEAFPDVKLGGCDVNRVALDFAQNNVPGVIIDYADAMDLNTVDKFDIVFTHGVLMHTIPESIDCIIDNMIDKSTKYIMHMERAGEDGVLVRGPENAQKKTKRFVWQPNISEMYTKRGLRVIEKERCALGMPKTPTLYLVIEK